MGGVEIAVFWKITILMIPSLGEIYFCAFPECQDRVWTVVHGGEDCGENRERAPRGMERLIAMGMRDRSRVKESLIPFLARALPRCSGRPNSNRKARSSTQVGRGGRNRGEPPMVR